MVERMETEHTEDLEILPAGIGSLPSTEAAPLLKRAASRIDIVRPKSEFWNGMQENLKGAADWIEAQKAKFKGRTLNMAITAALTATMLQACSKPPETPFISTEAPRATEAIPTEMPIPTETPTQTPTVAPTIEASPTPTEIPMYEGPMIENPWDSRNKIEGRGRLDMDIYNFYVVSTLVQKVETPNSRITEYIWGFSLDGNDYLYKVSQAPITVPVTGEDEYVAIGYFLPETEIGTAYAVQFLGTNEQITEDIFTWETDGTDLEGRKILESLRVDTADQTRLRNFFTRGDSSGFEVDERGIVDLTKVVIMEDIFE